MTEQNIHVVVYGATSFVGQIVCRYFMDTYGVDGQVKWAMAGRSQEKLEALRSEFGAQGASIPLMQADAFDATALKNMCDKTQVVLSTVGPYALYGEELIKACVEAGTDYVDLTGEVPWMRDMLDKYEAASKQSGARLIHCCGFDSIPSDLGVWHLQHAARAKHGQACHKVHYRLKAAKGGWSGGTVASLLNVAKNAGQDASMRKILADPYALCSDSNKADTKQHEVVWAEHDDHLDQWIGPFVMAGINTRVVHRSNQLSDFDYGQDFQYDEAVITGHGSKGWLLAQSLVTGMAGFLLSVAVGPTRWLLQSFVLPKPGQGPSPEAQESGFFNVLMYGETPSGETITTKVTGDRDPGYGSTAKMIAEAALCLSHDVSKSEIPGGFWTPSTALGSRLLERLEANAGVRFELI